MEEYINIYIYKLGYIMEPAARPMNHETLGWEKKEGYTRITRSRLGI